MDFLQELTRLNVATSTEVPYFLVAFKLLCGVCAGALIGLERSLHGRPVGIRTYCIVGLATVSVVQLVIHAPIWLDGVVPGIMKLDTSRIMRAVITGISFLCAGVIFRIGFSVQGLTTAASIWATAIIGLVFGTGFFFIGGVATAFVVIILALFRRFEIMLMSKLYARFNVIFSRKDDIREETFLALLAGHNLEAVGNVNQAIINEGEDCEFTATVRSDKKEAFTALSQTVRQMPQYKTFSIEFLRD